MPARIFRNSDDWRNATLTCPKCGWVGKVMEGDVDYHSEVMDSHCPRCPEDAPMLAIVSIILDTPRDKAPKDQG